MNEIPVVQEQLDLGLVMVLLASAASLAFLIFWGTPRGEKGPVRIAKILFWVAIVLWVFVAWNAVPFVQALALHWALAFSFYAKISVYA